MPSADPTAAAPPRLVPLEGRATTDLVRFRRQRRERHWTMLIVAVVILAASCMLRLRDTGQVALTWLPEISLPPLCLSRAWWGVECPGCGLTRSFAALSAGDFSESLRLHRVGWLLYVAVAVQIPYRAYKLRQLRLSPGQSISEPTWPIWFGRFLIAALIGSWLLKVSGR